MISGLRRLACLLAFFAVSTGAFAQAFPTKPILILSGFPPGFLDVVLRAMSPVVSQELGQQVVVDFRVGAGGALATDAVVRAAPDGYTLVFAEHSSVVYMQHLRKDLPYDPYRDLALVSAIYKAPFVVLGGPTSKSGNLRELIAEAKANPGKISYAHSGNGTIHHLAMELFLKRAGIKMLAVPFKGGAPSRQAAVAGTVDIVISGEDVTRALVIAGKLKALSTTSETRLASLPDMPTIGELLPGYSAYSAGSVFAPVATPRPIVIRLHAAMLKALRDPETAKKLVEMGLDPAPRSLEEGDRQWRAEGEVWADVIKSTGIRLE